MYTIVQTGKKVLVQKAAPVRHFDKRLRKIISEMEETLKATVDPKGVGLAAPQVGLSIRLFVVKQNDKAKSRAFINPEILSIPEDDQAVNSKPKRRRKLLEGCLSVQNIWGHVERKREVRLRYQDRHGRVHEGTFRGFLATIVQHEVDHLNGILFTKHVLAQGETLYRSHKNEKGEDEFEEIKI